MKRNSLLQSLLSDHKETFIHFTEIRTADFGEKTGHLYIMKTTDTSIEFRLQLGECYKLYFADCNIWQF